MAGDQGPFVMGMGSSMVDPVHALKLRNFTAAEEVMTGGALSRPMKGLPKTKKDAEEAAAVAEAMKKKAEEAAAVAEAMKKAQDEAMKKYDEAAAVAEAMKKKAGEAAAVAEAMKKDEEEAMKKAEVAAAIAEAMKNKAEEVAVIAVAEDSASLAEATNKMEELATVAETVKSADVVLSPDEEDAGDFSDEEDIPLVKVHDQKTVDYILSWTYAERNPFENLYDDDDEDYDGFVTAEEKEICAYFAERTKGLIEFQQEARKEYEATGYITVPDDYEERYAHLQAVLRSEGMVQDA